MNEEIMSQVFDAYLQGWDMYKLMTGTTSGEQSSTKVLEENDALVDRLFKQNEIKFKRGIMPGVKHGAFYHGCSEGYNLDNVRHRLYFKFGDKRVYMVENIMHAFASKGLEFYIKWSHSTERQEDTVLYVEEDKLDEAVSVISELAERFPEITDQKSIAPTMVDGGWFGYGVEVGDRSISYNAKVVMAMDRAFRDPEIYNKYRENMYIMHPSMFLDGLYNEYLNNKVAFLPDTADINAFDRTMTRENFYAFTGNRMFAQFFDKAGKGFIHDGNSAFRFKDYRGNELEISPNAVVDTFIGLCRKDYVTARFSADKKTKMSIARDFVEKFKEVMKENGLPIELPAELNKLKDMTRMRENAEMAM